jgi:hypothetical protein
LVLPGGFIGDFVNNTATAAQLTAPQVDLYGASSDGVAVVLGVDVIFPMGTEMEDIHAFVRQLVRTPDTVYTSFPPDMFTIVSDDIPTDADDVAEPGTTVDSQEATPRSASASSGVDISDLTEAVKNKSAALWKAANGTMFEAADKMNFGHVPVLVYIFWGVITLLCLVIAIALLYFLGRKLCCCCSPPRDGSGRSQDYLLRESHDQFGGMMKSPVRNGMVNSHPVELTPGRTPNMTPAQTNRICLSPTLGVLQMEPPSSVPDYFELNYVNAMNMRETMDSYVSGEGGWSERDQFPGPSHQLMVAPHPGTAADASPLSPVTSETSSYREAFEGNLENRNKRITSEDGFNMMPPAMLGSWGVQ